jgi:sulfate/thiosulfate transport system substrate-binding protein
VRILELSTARFTAVAARRIEFGNWREPFRSSRIYSKTIKYVKIIREDAVMLRNVLIIVGALYLLAATAWVVSSGVIRERGSLELLNVACDPTRELWNDLNVAFLRRSALPLTIRQSHGGSGSQARAVIDGLDADVVTLALFSDTDAIRKAGLVDANWLDHLPNRSLPFVSTIVFVVRKGNPKHVREWPDLLRDDVQVVTPNPKTSGNGKWSFLALWAALRHAGYSEHATETAITNVYRRVPVLDASARGCTMTFAQKLLGDVHLTWENEAHLEVQESRGELEIVYPRVSILAEPHVALVDRVVDRKGTRTMAEAYLKFLYTEAAQELIAKHHYRPTHDAVIARTADRFPIMTLIPANRVGTWAEIQQRFFAEGGVFDAIYGGKPR